MKRPTESEIYGQAFEFVSRCNSFRKLYVEGRSHYYRVPAGRDGCYASYPPKRIWAPHDFADKFSYSYFGTFDVSERRTFWEWLTRKPSEKLQWIQALDAAAALLR